MSDADWISPVPPPDSALLESMGFVRIATVDPAAGAMRAEFDAQARFCHTNGSIVQGGFVTAWLDFAMAHAAMLKVGHETWVASLELKISFLRRVGPGRVVAEGRIARLGRAVAFLEGTLYDPAGVALATASSTAMLTTAR